MNKDNEKLFNKFRGIMEDHGLDENYELCKQLLEWKADCVCNAIDDVRNEITERLFNQPTERKIK